MTPPKLNRIIETILYAEDLGPTAAFYRDILGLREFSRSDDHFVFFAVGSAVLLLFNPNATINQTTPPHHGANGPGHIAFEIESDPLDTWRQYLTDSGIAIEEERSWENETYHSLYIRDPAGNSVELITRPAWRQHTHQSS